VRTPGDDLSAISAREYVEMGARSEPIRVLHVDDDPAFVDLTQTYLEREDGRIEVTTATSTDEGFDRLGRSDVDCIVSDYDMPGLNGIEFLEAVRETHPDLPFVLFTGKGSEEVASDAISAGVTDYLQKSPGREQYEILVNRVVNAVDAARAQERVARQEHINTLMREINQRLVAVDTVDGIERAVCRALANSASYRFAWLGEPDPDGVEIVPRTSAGDAKAYLEAVDIHYDDGPLGQGPGGRAVRTGKLQVAQAIPDDPSFEPWQDAVEEYGYESVAVVPISYGDGRRRVLAIYADHPDAFSDVELTVLEELGETIGQALEAAETRRRLESRRAAEADWEERYYRTLADALPNGAVAFFDTDLRYTVVGGTVFDQLDISPAEMEGSALTAVHSSAFQRDCLPHYRAALDGEERTFEFEYGERTFEAHVAPVRDANDDVVGGLAMTQDVSERVERQRELERRERILRETYEVVADPSLSVTEGIRRLLRIGVKALDAQYGILSRTEDESYVLELVHAADGASVGDGYPAEGDAVPPSATNCERVIDAGETVAVGDVSEDPALATRPPYAENGLSCYVGAPVVVDGDVYGTFCFYDEDRRPNGFPEWEVTLVDLLARWVGAALDRDETTTQLRRQNERFREFTSIVSHDLRNPISVLSGALELAEADGDPAQFDRCRRAIDRMDALVEDLSVLTREGAVIDDTESVRLRSVATDCWTTVDTGDADVRIDGDATFRADVARLRQLLENLFRNSVEHGSTSNRTEAGDAVEHGSAGDDSLTVRVGVLADGTGFYVEDDGVGIPEKRQAEVFDRGYTTSATGTGLGLSIVEKMAAAHGWTVTVAEGRDAGTRIEVRGVDCRAVAD
jgi:signal transduction histidine kinase/DNA-binding NarL/FixJ family response regulator